jgi:hypothetical protein
MMKQPSTKLSSFDDNNQIKDLEAPLIEKTIDDDDHHHHHDDSNNNKVIDAKCHLVSKSYFVGIFVGIVLQALSFFASMMIKTSHIHDVAVAFVLYVFTKYWMPLALLLPAAIVALRSRSLPGHLRLESFFESLRFQFGLFFGSLLLLSLVNFYALAHAAPLPLLLSYYAVCLAVSFIALCLLQVFVNEVCANVSSIEVIVNYEDDNKNTKGSSN